MSWDTPLQLTVAIPTLGRSRVLVETIRQLTREDPPCYEILILDQTPPVDLDEATRAFLQDLHERGPIRWLQLEMPSQPAALNRGLLEARGQWVLFLDDDIQIHRGLFAAHVAAYADPSIWAVAGQVLQPGQEEVDWPGDTTQCDALADLEFPFNSRRRTLVQNGMSGNLSVIRERAVEIGGFDENFLGPVSYRFDAEFCKRLVRAGGRILYEPAASIRHLRAPRGGTRTRGSHLTSPSPLHGVGEYYFLLRQDLSLGVLGLIAARPFREVCRRFHARHPWWIPVKLVGEFRAMLLARRLARRGPNLLTRP